MTPPSFPAPIVTVTDLPNLDEQQAELAALVTRLTPGEGMHASAIPRVHA